VTERTIIHFNVADFAVAVERIVDSRLRARPVIIAPVNAARAAVYDMSDEAYGAGIRKGMALGRAMRLCREAVLLPPHPQRYGRAMRAFLQRVLPYSPLVEQAGGDGHLFVDTTGTHRLFGPPPDIAWRIRRTVRKELNLDPIWSVAPNKLVAKVASRLVKPAGEYIVSAGEEVSFLKPLLLALLPGLTRAELAALYELNLVRAGEVGELSLAQLSILFGRRARFLYETVRGIDSSAVLPAGEKRPVVCFVHRFNEDTNDAAMVRAALYALAEKCGSELRKRQLATRRVRLFLDYSDGVAVDRQAATGKAVANDDPLFVLAGRALACAWQRRIRLTSLRLCCDRLMPPFSQLLLFAAERISREREERLMSGIDRIRSRFGEDSIWKGSRPAARAA